MRLTERGFDWLPMQVHISNAEPAPLFQPDADVSLWSDELAYLRYGLGNFYGLDGRITHYHNWYDRIVSQADPQRPHRAREFPAAFINAYSQRFLDDYRHGRVDLPRDLSSSRVPVAL